MPNYKTHSTIGFILSIYFILIIIDMGIFADLTIYHLILSIIMFVLGANLPDIDHPNAKLSQWIPFLPTYINKKYGHRTITHSIIPISIIYIPSIIISLVVYLQLGKSIFVIAFSSLYIGCISHIFSDMFTLGGVCALYPFSKRRYSVYNTIILFIPTIILFAIASFFVFKFIYL